MYQDVPCNTVSKKAGNNASQSHGKRGSSCSFLCKLRGLILANIAFTEYFLYEYCAEHCIFRGLGQSYVVFLVEYFTASKIIMKIVAMCENITVMFRLFPL